MTPDTGRESGARDEAAGKISFDEVVDRYYNRVFRVALHVTGGREDAEDVCQEVFLYLLGHLGEFRGESALFTWIFRITRSASLRALARKKPARMPDNAPEPAAPPAPPRPGETAEKRSAILAAFAALPETHRVVASMHLLEGVPLKDVAALLETPEGTVRWWLFKARETLRALLKDWAV